MLILDIVATDTNNFEKTVVFGICMSARFLNVTQIDEDVGFK